MSEIVGNVDYRAWNMTEGLKKTTPISLRVGQQVQDY
jgi:hypothetical protein